MKSTRRELKGKSYKVMITSTSGRAERYFGQTQFRSSLRHLVRPLLAGLTPQTPRDCKLERHLDSRVQQKGTQCLWFEASYRGKNTLVHRYNYNNLVMTLLTIHKLFGPTAQHNPADDSSGQYRPW